MADIGLMIFSFFMIIVVTDVFNAVLEYKDQNQNENYPRNREKSKVFGVIVPRLLLYIPLLLVVSLFVT
jgi:heme/copper-type cytochrome/quinol oxidase subunit 2